MKPEVICYGIFDIQVCIPSDWSDDQIRQFAETEYPCGTTHGWRIRRSDSEERVKCFEREGYVHIMLDA